MKSATVAMAYLVFAAGQCWAADPVPIPPTTDWAPLETVVVTRKPRVPLFWHVKKGDFGNLEFSAPSQICPKIRAGIPSNLATVVEAPTLSSSRQWSQAAS